MGEPMTVHIEVWPVAADEVGLWLVSGIDAWRPDLPVGADSGIHPEVELELHRHGVLDDVKVLHSTSWRPEPVGLTVTYLAVVARPGFVRENWPAAEPISTQLPAAVGRPLTHGATEPPTPRHVDVLFHALRHVAWLLRTDATVAAELDHNWRTHLSGFEPALAKMYQDQHRNAGNAA